MMAKGGDYIGIDPLCGAATIRHKRRPPLPLYNRHLRLARCPLPMPTPTTAKTNLQRLALVRLIVLGGQLAAILYAAFWLRAPLEFPWLVGVTLAMAAATAFTFWRAARPWPVTDPEYFAQLLLDVAGLGALLYFSGGATNPFISYLLVPLSIAAAILPSAWTVALALIGVGLYSVLLFFYQPLAVFQPDAADVAAHIAMGHGPANAAQSPTLNAHIFGMWCNFALSSLLITYVVARMAATVREQQAELNRHREDTLHNEQLLAVATLAAGTAHELGTPLGTMTVLLDDMRSDDDALQADIELLKQQVTTCRTTLKNLVDTAQSHSERCADDLSMNGETQTLTAALHRLLERWQVLRPRATHRLQLHGTAPVPRLPVDAALQQAIINLLNNAADTDSGPIEISADWDETWMTLHIRDRGPGIALELADKLGKPFVTTKKGKGLGLGLFLSHATIERHGGDIRLFNHPDGGTEAVLRLPVVTGQTTKR